MGVSMQVGGVVALNCVGNNPVHFFALSNYSAMNGIDKKRYGHKSEKSCLSGSEEWRRSAKTTTLSTANVFPVHRCIPRARALMKLRP